MNKRKKIVLLSIIGLLVVMLCMVGVVFNNLSKIQLKAGQEGHLLEVEIPDHVIYSFDELELSYICLPSYMDSNFLVVDSSLKEMLVNGQKLGKIWHFQYDAVYMIALEYEGVRIEKSLMFQKSAAVNTMYVDTKSGSMEQIWADKDYKEAAVTKVFDTKGKKLYSGELEYIKGRGNSTFSTFRKKPYAIKFPEKISLFGMKEQKKYVLLANAFDRSGFSNLIALDMGRALGMRETPNCAFVDLYINGEYAGNYQMCDPVSMKLFDADSDNMGVPECYIVEKDLYFEQEEYQFVTKDGNPFSVKEPDVMTKQELLEIGQQIQQIEDLILSGDERVFDYLDLDSFARRYLIERLMGNVDFSVSSMYFYKLPQDPKLYSGPLWDYDRCFGLMGWRTYSPDVEMEMTRLEMLTWFSKLEQNEQFVQYCANVYENWLRPYIVELLDTKLNQWVNTYERAIRMNHAVCYENRSYNMQWEASIKYIKYYLAGRVNFYDQKYGVDAKPLSYVGDGTEHTLIVLYGDETFVYTVLDGECFTIPVELDMEEYDYWCILENELVYEANLPILENKNIIAHKRYADED